MWLLFKFSWNNWFAVVLLRNFKSFRFWSYCTWLICTAPVTSNLIRFYYGISACIFDYDLEILHFISNLSASAGVSPRSTKSMPGLGILYSSIDVQLSFSLSLKLLYIRLYSKRSALSVFSRDHPVYPNPVLSFFIVSGESTRIRSTLVSVPERYESIISIVICGLILGSRDSAPSGLLYKCIFCNYDQIIII